MKKLSKAKLEAAKADLFYILRHDDKDMRDFVKNELKILLEYSRVRAAAAGCPS